MLGEHKLLVGDATNTNDVAPVSGTEVADLVVTDPPYTVNYEGYTEQKLKIKGDCMSDAGLHDLIKRDGVTSTNPAQ